MRDDHDVTVIETDTGSGLKWFLIGAALGAGLGVLLAPDSGKATRRELAHRGRKLRSRAGELVEDFSDEVQRRGKKLRSKVDEFAEDIEDDLDPGEEATSRKGSDVRSVMEQRLADARARSRAAAGVGDEDEDDVEDDDEPV